MMKIALFALLVEIAAARIPASLLLPEMHPGCQVG